jgi:hypothetical protein
MDDPLLELKRAHFRRGACGYFDEENNLLHITL